MIIIILLGLILALIAPLVHRIIPRFSGVWLSILPLGIFAWSIFHLDAIIIGDPIINSYTWVDVLSLPLVFRLDGLSIFFLLLISGFGFFIFVYANSYLQGDSNKGKFYIYLSLFMTAMMGLVLSGN